MENAERGIGFAPAVSEPATAPSLARVARGNTCAGCGACAAIAAGKVRMAVAVPGYLRPVQSAPLSRAEDEAIQRVCPGLGQMVEAGDRTDDVLFGPYVSMRTAWATDDGIRHAGASGGGLSAMLLHLVQSGAVDAVIETTASADLAIGNATVVTAGRDGILGAAGSRYAPSAPLENLQDRLAEHEATGRRFAFVGKPCDAAAMAALRAADPKVAAAVPVILSFFCAGVPSHAGGRAVLKALEAEEARVRSFRYRGNGWPGRATATLDDGTERSMTYHESWGKILSRHVQHRCKICPDGTGVMADIVCADAWESDEGGYPVFEEQPGISLMVARTALGERLVRDAEAAGRIGTAPFDVGTLPAIQPGQRERRRALAARLLALRVAGRPVPRYQGLRILAAARQNSAQRNMKNFLGMIRRSLKRRP
ncbi:Coenzyme F420 hydrogenase/dehydrogenase, beta subunit C-terminal domain [Rubellimicrobium aerolatum]|uniref:Coenzyme F420 hydrogenase/dehydrogenase, beta subunit C-terminal domain n=1 Tax=Rubellimicrobium aerolatum TaxID=490979 RepID=A0ABW0S9G7_9RHOB|nr:Coenzyme F420 hydrogenase/dehydrogenase, beta subunit C-terminal domain [Rubellimicrobium aerolatum]MBP1804926.1 coenzyme F420 hydrogenase subunit beta [Rubellimicrobium aerolatum]